MTNRLFALAALAIVSFGCGEPGDQVALNSRLFDAQSMASRGASCTVYMLGGRGNASTAGGTMEFLVSEQQTETAIDVTVTRGDEVVVARHYDAAFFHAGTVDEFTAPGTTGNGLLLRYWGQFHPGADACTPLGLDSPR